MPEITKEQLAVIAAAIEYRHSAPSTQGPVDALMEAVDALPNPYQPLVGQRELELIASQSSHHIDDMRDAIVLGLRAAADRVENGGTIYAVAGELLRQWSAEEEKLAEGE